MIKSTRKSIRLSDIMWVVGASFRRIVSICLLVYSRDYSGFASRNNCVRTKRILLDNCLPDGVLLDATQVVASLAITSAIWLVGNTADLSAVSLGGRERTSDWPFRRSNVDRSRNG